MEKGLAAGPVAMKVLKKVVIREFELEDGLPFELPLYITLKKRRMSCSFGFWRRKDNLVGGGEEWLEQNLKQERRKV